MAQKVVLNWRVKPMPGVMTILYRLTELFLSGIESCTKMEGEASAWCCDHAVQSN